MHEWIESSNLKEWRKKCLKFQEVVKWVVDSTLRKDILVVFPSYHLPYKKSNSPETQSLQTAKNNTAGIKVIPQLALKWFHLILSY